MPSAVMRGLSVCALLFFAGCGPRLGDGEALEKQGRFLKAAEKYRSFALRNPAHPSAPKALASAAELYSVKLGLCAESKPLLERLVREYPSYRISGELFRRIFVCPDYFPVKPGSAWTYGDSQTLGKNAREVSRSGADGKGGVLIETRFYAGDELVSGQKGTYRFSGTDFLEARDGMETVILDYPLEKGKSWTSLSPEGKVRFRVEEQGVSVKVGAGEFAGCVKVRRQPEGVPSWIYEYYAPWTGKVMTSVGGEGFENRVTELLSYEEKK